MAQCQVGDITMKDYCVKMVELRKEHNYTQEYVAKMLQVDRSNYSKYELGKLEISIDMLIALAKLYGVSTDYILGLAEF